MKLTTILAAALLPAGLMAAPVVDEVAEITPRTDAANEPSQIFKRDMTCYIIGGASRVNCRGGPGTKWKVVRTVKKGSKQIFHCVRSGECVTINGFRNW